MAQHRLSVFSDYFQFYLWDAGTNPRAPEVFTNGDVERMVKVEPHVLVVQPVRNMIVPVEVSVLASDPGCNLREWDHVVECSLDLPTGHLQVHECTGDAVLDTHVEPGMYAVRVMFKNLDSLIAGGLDGDDEYRIDLWPDSAQDLTVTKWRRSDVL